MRWRLTVVTVALTAVLAACGGTSPTAEWKTGKDVLDAVKQAGFACDYSGTEEQVRSGGGLLGADSEVAAVNCTDYGVVLLTSRAEFVDDIASSSKCEAPDDMQLASMTVVIGENFLVVPADTWPGAAQPEDFTKQFGGQETTLIDLLKEACPDTVFPDVPATPDVTRDTAALDSALLEAATDMETAYTTNNAYPASLEGSGFVAPPGVTVELAEVTDSAFCLAASDASGAVRYYDSASGGLTATPCSG